MLLSVLVADFTKTTETASFGIALHPDPLDFVEADLVASAVVKLGGASAGMVGHGGRIFQCAAIL